jgi:aspartyl-tRNA(Asn)/glutamyl-tRNA(Gln) amidotransferase subunit B
MKEEAHDYRYFPEPDLVPLRATLWVDAIRAELPELPDARRERFLEQYGIADDHAKSLTSEIKVANFYEEVARSAPPREAAVWTADVLKGELNYRGQSIDSFRPEHMVEILEMLKSREIAEKGATEIIRTLLDSGGSPRSIADAKGLGRAGEDFVMEAVRAAVAECGEAVNDYRSGNDKALNYIVGQVMKKTKGTADPALAHRLVREQLGEA